MKLIYIAGPFTGKNALEISQNVARAEYWAAAVAECGAMPICVHSLGKSMHGIQSEAFWYDGTLEVLKRCDAALFINGWPHSKGCQSEYAFCKANGILTFAETNLPHTLKLWLKDVSAASTAAQQVRAVSRSWPSGKILR